MAPAPANDLLLRALRRQPTPRTPVWLMRQAGRYLPEYRATRERAGSFLTLCTTPELACEVTLQPLARFPLDAAILFSDILTLPHAYRLGLDFEAGEGPVIANPVRSAADVERLPLLDPETELRFVLDAVRLIRRELGGRVPLIGFAGSPWTVATYMLEGGSSRDFARSKALLYGDPAILHRLLGKLARATTDYLNAQIHAGAQAVMLFDTWGGALAPVAYREFSLNYMAEVIAGLERERDGASVPAILFTKGAGLPFAALAASGADALGLDWLSDLGQVRALVGERVALQGNLDPAVLYAPPEAIRREVGRVLASFGHGAGHVFNLGHGIRPDVDPAHVAELIASVHALSPPYHA